jgi:hypothetical protein
MLAISVSGWRTVVRGGMDQRAASRSSKPTTLTSCGTRSPRSYSASYVPSAVSSEQAKMAVGRWARSSRALVSRYPEDAVKSPVRT